MRLSLAALVLLVGQLGVGSAPPGARALFYGPALTGATDVMPPGLQITDLAPVRSASVQFVGIHYWFQNHAGERFAEPGAVPRDEPVTLHVRANVGGFLSVWLSDADHASVELTPRSDAGRLGQWTGVAVEAGQEFVVPADLRLTSVGEMHRVLVLFARSQTEQVDDASECHAKLQRLAAQLAADGSAALVREVEKTTPSQIGTYVVHRLGGQAGAEIVLSK